MSYQVATNIPTDLWYLILESLKTTGWKLNSQYELFDKGIDYDSYELIRNNDKIFLIWDNWIEGELKCNQKVLIELEEHLKIKFEFGNSIHFNNKLEK